VQPYTHLALYLTSTTCLPLCSKHPYFISVYFVEWIIIPTSLYIFNVFHIWHFTKKFQLLPLTRSVYLSLFAQRSIIGSWTYDIVICTHIRTVVAVVIFRYCSCVNVILLSFDDVFQLYKQQLLYPKTYVQILTVLLHYIRCLH
jgi:hypothetical protein